MVILRGDKNKLYEKFLRDYMINVYKMLGEKTLNYEDEIITSIIKNIELMDVTLLTAKFKSKIQFKKSKPNLGYII